MIKIRQKEAGMQTQCFTSLKLNTMDAIKECVEKCTLPSISHVIGFSSISHDPKEIQICLKEILPNASFHISSSCLGTMTQEGVKKGDVISLMFFEGKEASFGTSIAQKEKGIRNIAKEVVKNSIKCIDRAGETPSAIWITGSPGAEEKILEGITSAVGSNVPVVGGSSGDNEINGKWFQVTNKAHSNEGLAVTSFFSENVISASFHCGYNPSPYKGVITKSEGRTVYEIDNRPAALVYNEWTGNRFADFLGAYNTILSESGLFPLGRKAGEIAEIPYYKLSHPESVDETNRITFFTDIKEGEEVVLMEGDVEELIKRSGKAINSAMKVSGLEPNEITGCLMTFCAGCMLTLDFRMDEAFAEISQYLPSHIPLLAGFTFGEQGQLVEGENAHGNLMFSVVLFSNKRI